MDERDLVIENVVVIGGGGRVGYPFACYTASRGFNVVAYDRDPDAFVRAKTYKENNAIDADDLPTLTLTSHVPTYEYAVKNADVIVIMIGTPIDAEGNPRTDGIDAVISELNGLLADHSSTPLVILRSTVCPGLTIRIEREFFDKADVVFAPERISQGHSFEEIPNLPQIIGSNDGFSGAVAEEFFTRLGVKECIHLDTTSAELGKLMTNMYRYINFAIANEFMMLAHYYGCDFETIRQAINKNYPRMNLYGAGAAAGPCLAKDGQFMVAHVPYPEMIRTASVVNEALPAWIFKQLKDTLVSKVAILGMTFKADNDDTRHSLSFKLKKILTREGYDVVCYDRYVPEYSDVSVLESCGAYVLMTPHSYFDDEFYDNHIASQSVIIDVWKHFPRSKISADYNINGIYYKVEPNEF